MRSRELLGRGTQGDLGKAVLSERACSLDRETPALSPPLALRISPIWLFLSYVLL